MSRSYRRKSYYSIIAGFKSNKDCKKINNRMIRHNVKQSLKESYNKDELDSMILKEDLSEAMDRWSYDDDGPKPFEKEKELAIFLSNVWNIGLYKYKRK